MNSVIQFVKGSAKQEAPLVRQDSQTSDIDSPRSVLNIEISDTNQNNAGVERQVSVLGNYGQRRNSLHNQFEANQQGGSLAQATKATQVVAISLVLALTFLSIASLGTWATATDADNCRDAPTIGLV